MVISTLIESSTEHVICEDAFFVEQTEYYIRGGIFDGCSSGKNSVWASNTLKHIFSNYPHFYFLSDATVRSKISKLRELKDFLKLEPTNLESTALLFEYLIEEKILYVRAFGDGSYFVNGDKHTINENNVPDYLGHYVDCSEETIDDYLERHHVTKYEGVENFCICSDGIDKISISPFKDHKRKSEILFNPVTSKTQLDRYWTLLKRDGWLVKDDLTIISVNNVSTPV